MGIRGKYLTLKLFWFQRGANNCQRDYEGLAPLDLIVKDRLPHVEFLHSGEFYKMLSLIQRLSTTICVMKISVIISNN